ncbi:MAG TPA: nucleotidyltransferase family protein [Candidatus Polarisedimenticolia bacterium]|nr:nucleotidyltransferase family protein [Candidatus Polarisedimenticolia bacterium]
MFGETSRARARVGDGAVSPSVGLPGLLAAPVPQDEPLRLALASLSPAERTALLDRIVFHRIDGLAHRAVERLPQDSLDPWLRVSLKRRSQRCAAAALSQALALEEILDALHRSSIAVIVMRGIRTLEGTYGDAALRPFEDHDLLVRPEEREAARGTLLRLGYVEQARGLFRRGGVTVDLHVEPLGTHRRPRMPSLFSVRVEELFARANWGHVAGAPSLHLEAEDELLLLALHLVKHSFDRLVCVADVAHFVHRKRGSMDWALLGRRAEACGASRMLGWALQAAALLGVDVRAVDRPVTEDDGPLARFLLSRAFHLRPMPYTGEALMALAAPTLRARVSFLLHALWPAGERPEGTLRGTAALPRRVVHLAEHGAARMARRRRM